MNAKLISLDNDTVTIELKVKLGGSMLASEAAILNTLNEAGCIATKEALTRFDTDGSRIELGDDKWFSKGQLPKQYQTPFGEIEVERHVYQRAKGGKTFCPLEYDARIVVTSTPRFAKQVSHKFSYGASTVVQRDFAENHNRAVARSFVQELSDAVGSIVQAKEETWHYVTPKLKTPVATVALGLDGTCLLMCQDGYREAMTGTLSLYDAQGERLHTIYLGATPQYGKAAFQARMARETAHIKTLYPDAIYVGVADGASTNWDFLSAHVSTQILDFYHVAGYVADAAEAAFPRDRGQRAQWLDRRCHDLKHKQGAARRLLREMEQLAAQPMSAARRDKLAAAITYFSNHTHQMNYALYRTKGYPIGSGVTEAACKTLVKQRLCCSGMKWREKGASLVLSLRALMLTPQRWEQFWDKVEQYGFQLAN